MTLSFRTIILVTIPTITALLGFFWFKRKKKPPMIEYPEAEDASRDGENSPAPTDAPEVQITAPLDDGSNEDACDEDEIDPEDPKVAPVEELILATEVCQVQSFAELKEWDNPGGLSSISSSSSRQSLSPSSLENDPTLSSSESASNDVENRDTIVDDTILMLSASMSQHSNTLPSQQANAENSHVCNGDHLLAKDNIVNNNHVDHEKQNYPNKDISDQSQTSELSACLQGSSNKHIYSQQTAQKSLQEKSSALHELNNSHSDSTPIPSSNSDTKSHVVGDGSLSSSQSISQDTGKHTDTHSKDETFNANLQGSGDSSVNATTTSSLVNHIEAEVFQMTGAVEKPASLTPSSIGSPVGNGSVSSCNGSNCDAHSELSTDTGDSGIVTASSVVNVGGAGDAPPRSSLPDYRTYEFDFPTKMCGLLIGRNGRNVQILIQRSGADISVKKKMMTEDYQSVCLEGSQKEIDAALKMIKQKFPPSKHNIDYTQSPPEIPILPQILQFQPTSPSLPSSDTSPPGPQIWTLNLPEGCALDIRVSSVVAPNHVFVQQPTHPSHPNLDSQDKFMLMVYGSQDSVVPQLPRPIDVGVICVAPMYTGWYRAQVVNTYPETDECDIKFVDYGGYLKLQGCMLRQIRSDFTTLPFQATECYLANVAPPAGFDVFPVEANAMMEQLVHGHMLQGEIVGWEEDGSVPYINLYLIANNRLVLLNRELVNSGVASWIENSS